MDADKKYGTRVETVGQSQELGDLICEIIASPQRGYVVSLGRLWRRAGEIGFAKLGRLTPAEAMQAADWLKAGAARCTELQASARKASGAGPAAQTVGPEDSAVVDLIVKALAHVKAARGAPTGGRPKGLESLVAEGLTKALAAQAGK